MALLAGAAAAAVSALVSLPFSCRFCLSCLCCFASARSGLLYARTDSPSAAGRSSGECTAAASDGAVPAVSSSGARCSANGMEGVCMSAGSTCNGGKSFPDRCDGNLDCCIGGDAAPSPAPNSNGGVPAKQLPRVGSRTPLAVPSAPSKSRSSKRTSAAAAQRRLEAEYKAARPGKRPNEDDGMVNGVARLTSGGIVGGQAILYPNATNTQCSDIDWRRHPTINPEIRTQTCANCWLLSAVELVEHFYASYAADAFTKYAYADGTQPAAAKDRLRANYPVLSTQQIADCASSISAQGSSCQTGSPAFALDYIMQRGIMGAANYTAFKEQNPPLPGETCPSNMVTGEYSIESFSSLYETCLESSNTVQLDCEEFAAKEILIAHQLRETPLLVSVDASTWTMPAVARLIENENAKAAAKNDGSVAIFDRVNLRCSSSASRQTHSMMLVGLQFSKTQGWYWVLKNTWGPQWGDKGCQIHTPHTGRHGEMR